MKAYTNRYGDEFTFEYNERGNIQWSGNFEYHRTAFNDNPDDIIMVDPSGGPYIELGCNMSLFGMEGKVVGFISNENGYEIILDRKTQPIKEILNKINRVEYIDSEGRQLVRYGKHSFSIQDNGQTLKIFKEGKV